MLREEKRALCTEETSFVVLVGKVVVVGGDHGMEGRDEVVNKVGGRVMDGARALSGV